MIGYGRVHHPSCICVLAVISVVLNRCFVTAVVRIWSSRVG